MTLPRSAADVLAGLDVRASEISARVPTLDDVYLQLTGRSEGAVKAMQHRALEQLSRTLTVSQGQ